MVRKKTKKNKSYFHKFWDGELPLVQSYWVVAWLISLPVGFAIGFVGAVLGFPQNTIYAFLIPWYVFTTVGVWRSSDRYKGPKFWSVLAKLAMILAWISLVTEMVSGV